MTYPQDLSKIRHVVPQDPVSAQVTSQPTRALELRLRELESAVFNSESSVANSQLMLYDVDIKADVGLHNAVFFNPNSGLYELAAATVTMTAGTFVTNPSALVVGIVTALRGSKADVMVGGASTWGLEPSRTEMLNRMLVEGEAGFKPGAVYFLSADAPGQITQYPPSLKIQVLVSSAESFIVLPQYSTPEAIQNVYTNPVGMNPVGALRTAPPSQNQTILVGFDGLEQFDALNNQWRLTSEGSVATFVDFGYMVADAEVDVQPSSPVYVNVTVGTDGALDIFSASTLAQLYVGGSTFNRLVGGSALLGLDSGNFRTVRSYPVKDSNNKPLGYLKFKFTDYDVSLKRSVIFKFPDNFQGWKSVNAAITPQASATINDAGIVTSIAVVEGSIGFTTPPAVVITDAGSGAGATATAVINEFGTITGITVNTGGAVYTVPSVSFDTTVNSVQIGNTGSGATAEATVEGGVITGVTVLDAGSGYLSTPLVVVVDPVGVGSGANLLAEVFNGSVISVSVAQGGSGYADGNPPVLRIMPQFNNTYNPVDFELPVASIIGQTPAAQPVLTPVYGDMEIIRVDVLSAGIGYSPDTTIAISPDDLGAILHPVVDSQGHIVRVDIIDAGAGFPGTPTLAAANAVGFSGNGAVLQAVIGTSVQEILASTAGSGLSDPAIVVVGTPVLSLAADEGGSGYLVAPLVTIDAPDVAGVPIAQGGVQATAEALLGGTIQAVTITDPGSGYDPANPPVVTVTGAGSGAEVQALVASDGTIADVEIVSPGYGYDLSTIGFTITGTGAGLDLEFSLAGNMLGTVASTTITDAGAGYVSGSTGITVTPVGGSPTTAAILVPVVSNDGNGSILDIVISNAGAGYTAAPTLTFTGPHTTLATATAFLDGNSVVGFTITGRGNGYVTPPTVTIEPPPAGVAARSAARLVGGSLQTSVLLNGAGGKRIAQTEPLATGNNLQITDYLDNFPDVSRPTNAAWYYNIKADPNLRALYPAVPVDKLSFSFNGVGMLVSNYSEAQKLVINADADISVTRRTLLWTTNDNNGCPWDANVQQFIWDYAATGRDCTIPTTGPTPALQWKLWSHVFRYELQRNRGWVDLNKASRFFQTGRVASLAAMSPLRLIDTVTGAESKSDGMPMSGQLLLVNDSDTSLFKGTGAQITLTNPGELQAIFQNNTGRMVALSSILLTVVFQTTDQSLVPNASYAAQITIGTESGSYRNIVGNAAKDVFSTRLYAANQVKEIFPDADQPAPLIAPNDTVFLSVVQPAGAPIVVQTAVAYIKGNVL